MDVGKEHASQAGGIASAKPQGCPACEANSVATRLANRGLGAKAVSQRGVQRLLHFDFQLPNDPSSSRRHFFLCFSRAFSDPKWNMGFFPLERSGEGNFDPSSYERRSRTEALLLTCSNIQKHPEAVRSCFELGERQQRRLATLSLRVALGQGPGHHFTGKNQKAENRNGAGFLKGLLLSKVGGHT